MALSPDQRRRLLRMNMLMSYAAFASAKATTAWTPAILFANAEVGGWYDPSDLTTLFQDAAGTTPVTAVEQPVGLVLDKSRGLVLGSELVTNGDFSSSTGWTVAGSATISSGRLNLNAASDGAYYAISGLVAGRTYVVFLQHNNVPSNNGGASVSFQSTTGYTATAYKFFGTGTTTLRVVAGASPQYFKIYASNVGTYSSTWVDNISVRELPGNHLSQSTSTARPVLRATSRIDYDGTDDKLTCSTAGAGTTGFLFVAGINIDVIGAAQTVWSDTGTNTGYRVRINASNQLELAAGNGTAYTTVTTTETLSAATNYVIAAWHDGANLNVRLGSGGAIASQAFATATAGTAGFTIGMDNGAVSSQLNGKVYNAVYVKNFAGSLAAVNNTISYVNGKLT